QAPSLFFRVLAKESASRATCLYSGEACGFLLGRQSPVRCQLIDDIGQLLTKSFQQVIPGHSRKRCQCIDPICAECTRQVIWRDLLIGPGTNPRSRDFTLAVLLELFEQIVQASAQDASRRSASQQTAQTALEQVTKSPITRVRTLCACSARRSTSPSGRSACLIFHKTFDDLESKRSEHCHHHWRHAAATPTTGSRCTLATRCVLHAIEHINQAHMSLLLSN